MKYIDMHAHVFPSAIAPKVVHNLETYYGMKWGGDGTVEDFQKSMDENGIDRAVVFSTATKPEQVTVINDFISSQTDPRFIGFGTMHPDFTDYRAEIKRMKELGLRGIKLHPDFQYFHIDDIRMMRIFEEVGDTMPFIIHIGDKNTDYSSPYRLANVLNQLPHLKVVAAHLGGYSEWDEARKHLVGRDVYFDTSSTFWRLTFEEGEALIREHGVEKVLFATDYPAVKHDRAIEEIHSMNFTDEEKELFFYRNAQRLLGIEI